MNDDEGRAIVEEVSENETGNVLTTQRNKESLSATIDQINSQQHK